LVLENWPRPRPRPHGFGIDLVLGLEGLSLASALASAICPRPRPRECPHLTSLVKTARCSALMTIFVISSAINLSNADADGDTQQTEIISAALFVRHLSVEGDMTYMLTSLLEV